MSEKYQRDVYESQQLLSNVAGGEGGGRRAGGGDSPTRAGRSGAVNFGNIPGSSVADERLFRQREQKASNISGVFEGTAGTGGDSRFVLGSGEGASDGEETPSAYEFFRGKSFKSINFEDGFTVNRYLGEDTQRTGFSAGSAEVSFEAPQLTRATTMKQLEEISKSRKRVDLETPVERVTRLQREVTEMIAFIEAFMESRKIGLDEEEASVPAASGETPTDSERQIRLRARTLEEGRRFFGADPASLLKELNVLRNYLDGIISSDTYQALTTMASAEAKPLTIVDLAPRASPITAASVDFVKLQLDAADAVAKKTPTKVKDEAKAPAAAPTPFTYELYMVPSAKDALDTSRILELEKRLAELETQLGLSKGIHFSLPFSDVSSALKEIVSRLSLLHPSRLDGLAKRFQTLGLQVDELVHRRERLAAMQPKSSVGSTARDGTGTLAEEQTVSSLYDFCESTRPAAAALPVIVKRLKALKILHQEAASLTSRLDALETQQVDLAKLLDTTQNHFDTLRDAVQKNILWAKEVVEELERQH